MPGPAEATRRRLHAMPPRGNLVGDLRKPSGQRVDPGPRCHRQRGSRVPHEPFGRQRLGTGTDRNRCRGRDHQHHRSALTSCLNNHGHIIPSIEALGQDHRPGFGPRTDGGGCFPIIIGAAGDTSSGREGGRRANAVSHPPRRVSCVPWHLRSTSPFLPCFF